MQIFPGTIALSDFRKQKILEQLAELLPSCQAVETRFQHLVNLQPGQILDAQDRAELEQLLDYGHGVGNETIASSTITIERLTTPRIGTISPWATKATDIAHHCGLTKIHRIERGVQWTLFLNAPLDQDQTNALDETLAGIIYDPMTESLLEFQDDAAALFIESKPAPLSTIDILGGGMNALNQADSEFGFALTVEEKEYLVTQFTNLGRNPTDVELMMFAQVNSEHCRHKIFNADWTLDGEQQDQSLFGMIRTTHQKNGQGTLVAYNDNAAVISGSPSKRFQPNQESNQFNYTEEAVHFTAKVETHNHPTAIAPFSGAATGSGGEIRDEGATGRGGKPKAGLAGFSVSHLRIPGLDKPWEMPEAKPERIASPLQIMLEGPIGAAAFNNEFGRPNVTGYFRTFEQQSSNDDVRHGYHKPIMLAGGLGNIRPDHVEKNKIPSGAPIVVLGGPTMLIGLGGGAASSVASGSRSESLDFASVQRGNPEMQRRCQEVIDTCCAMGDQNPIVSIHDVGAGGICNALPELVHDAGQGGNFELRNVLNDEPGMSPMQIWCNESQERYVLAINPEQFAQFEEICARERCLYAKVGEATAEQSLKLTDQHFAATAKQEPIDLPMDLLFGLPPKMQREAATHQLQHKALDFSDVTIDAVLPLVLSHPAVADKTFLITIGDRSVTGMIVRDQMIGPWQVPVADCAVSTSGYQGDSGEAMAIGERTPIAVINAPASGRMAIGEAITNLFSSNIASLDQIKFSANWMVAAGEPGHDADLYRTVQSVALDLCPALGLAIPVGKDSMSMKTRWQQDDKDQAVVSPLSLVVTAFAAVEDVRKTTTPQLRLDQGETDLWLIDLGAGQNRLGGSILAQVYDQIGDTPPDVDSEVLKGFMQFISTLNSADKIKAYHDRSDGGLIATLLEMSFSARCGLTLDISNLGDDSLSTLFNEELGVVIQCARTDRELIEQCAIDNGLSKLLHHIGEPKQGESIVIVSAKETVLEANRSVLHRAWSEVTAQMQKLRDNPACAEQEYDRLLDLDDPGMSANLTFNPNEDIAAPYITSNSKPRIAILREQGVNGQLEMAAAFDRAGFEAIDVTMSDLSDNLNLESFRGFAACGGFSFGDVLGAGEGWAKSILFNEKLRQTFGDFFERQDTFALGVCNGCQMMSTIKELIPGADHWPKFIRNASEQYEARYVMVKIESEKSILMRGMKGSSLGISVAHGEGRAYFQDQNAIKQLQNDDNIAMRFVDNYLTPTNQYPFNANGSLDGVTGFTNDDGRFTIMMPHPERVFRTVTHSWHPDDWLEDSPWMRLFQNARIWVDQV